MVVPFLSKFLLYKINNLFGGISDYNEQKIGLCNRRKSLIISFENNSHGYARPKPFVYFQVEIFVLKLVKSSLMGD